MSVVETVHAAHVDRYRRVLELDASETAASLLLGADAATDPPLTGDQIDGMVGIYAAKLAKARRAFAKAAVEPVHPRALDARRYDREIRRVLLRPLMRNIRSGLSTAVAAAEAIETLDGVPLRTTRRRRMVYAQVEKQAKRLNGYHRRKLIATFRAALGVDIRPVLDDVAIRPLMDAWRRENVDLIRTVPERLMDDLRVGIDQAFRERPFDQQALRAVVREKGESAGWNLRRITRDQTNKAIGQLTRARHQQLGIEEYVWRTAQDERVRDEHVALNGTTQRWDEPTSEGFPGDAILCRCTAEPVLPEAGVTP